MNYATLLTSRGFTLNKYPQGNFWELVVSSDETLKIQLLHIFGAEFEYVLDDISDIDTIVLQCADDFTKCVFCYDCNDWDMSTDDFMQCVKQINL